MKVLIIIHVDIINRADEISGIYLLISQIILLSIILQAFESIIAND